MQRYNVFLFLQKKMKNI